MAKRRNLFGIIALVAIIMFSMTGCPNDTNNNGGSSGPGGPPLIPIPKRLLFKTYLTICSLHLTLSWEYLRKEQPQSKR